MAAGYTTPRIDKAGQALVAEDGSIAESQEEREQTIMAAHFPKAPPAASNLERVVGHSNG